LLLPKSFIKSLPTLLKVINVCFLSIYQTAVTHSLHLTA